LINSAAARIIASAVIVVVGIVLKEPRGGKVLGNLAGHTRELRSKLSERRYINGHV